MCKKTLLVTHQYLPRWYTGTEQLVSKTASYFNKIFLNFEILSAEPYTKKFFLNNYKRKVNNFRVNIMNYYSIENNYDLNSCNKKKYIKFLKEKKISSIIFFHTMRNQSVIYAAIELKIPYILVLTDYFLVCPKYSLIREDNVLCVNSENNKLCKKICGFENSVLKNRANNAKIFLDFSKKIFLSSEISKKNFSNHIDLDKEKIEIVDYGTDFIKDKNIKSKNKLHKVIKIAYFGSFIETKGVSKLLEFIDDLNENYEVTFCGSGYLKNKILKKKNKSTCKVKIIDPIKNNLLDREISNIDIGILLSYWPENNPLIVGKFLKMGKPMIVNNTGTLPSQVPNEICGKVLDNLNTKNFLNALNFIENNYETLSINARLQQTSLEDRFFSNLASSIKEIDY